MALRYDVALSGAVGDSLTILWVPVCFIFFLIFGIDKIEHFEGGYAASLIRCFVLYCDPVFSVILYIGNQATSLRKYWAQGATEILNINVNIK